MKRPAPEDGEIADTNTTITTPADKPADSIIGRIQGAATTTTTGTGPRIIKRPKGAPPKAGGLRRPSGPGAGGAGAGAGGSGGAGAGGA